MSVGEYEDEPVKGLPEYLPPDETLVWQGAPDFRTMARRVFHLRSVSLYFAILIAIQVVIQASGGESINSILFSSSWMVGLGLTAMGILALMAFAYARTTVYTLTDKRLVLRSGVAMPMMVNLPLSIVTAADLRQFPDGTGDIVFSLKPRKRLSYMMLWPNVRSWRINPVQPALRSVPNIDEVARKLASVVDSSMPGTTAGNVNANTDSHGSDNNRSNDMSNSGPQNNAVLGAS
jgi:hypothetical protein